MEENRQLSKTQFKRQMLEYMRDVELTGKPLIITDRGEPRLEIKKLRREKQDPQTLLKGLITGYNSPFDSVAGDDWELST